MRQIKVLDNGQMGSLMEAIMNQQEYNDVSDRVRVSNALQILENIIPEQSSVITPSELQHVLSDLRYLEKKLLEQIGII